MDRIEVMRAFVQIVEQHSFSAASRALRIKQSTASKWVADLEEQFGVSLLERTTRSLRTTDAGQRFYQRAKELLAGFDELTSELQERSPEPAGHLRVSVPVVFGRLFVVPLLADFLKQHPKVQAELVFSDRYVNLVEEGFDIAVRVGIPLDSSCRARKLADSRRYLVASPAYLRQRGHPESPDDLKDHECLLHGDPSVGVIWKFSRKDSVETPTLVRGRIAANNSEAILHMVRSGLGIALLADWLVEADLASHKLVPLLQEFETPAAPVYALLPPGRYLPSQIRSFLDHLSTSLPAKH